MAGPEGLGAVVVGTGFGVLTHLRALRAAGFEVHALVGRDGAKARARADLFGVPHALTSLDDALALPGVDAVAVATPPFTHADIVLAAVAQGKHVLCEKPFARDLDEARRMRDAAHAAGVVHLLGCEFRYATGQATLARAVRGGAIGAPQHATFVLQMGSLVDPDAGLPSWWEDAGQGGGWLGAYGSHVVDQIRTTIGEITGVSASLQRLAPRPQMTADDTFTVHFATSDGCRGVMHSSCAMGGPMGATTRIVGTSGTVVQQGEQVLLDTGGGAVALPVPDDLPLVAPVPPPAELLHTTYDYWHSMGIDLAPFTRLCAVLRDRIRGVAVGDDPPAPTFDDAVADQAVLDAIRRSAQRGGAWEQVHGAA